MKHLPFLLSNFWREGLIIGDTLTERPKTDIFVALHKIDNIST